MMLPHHRQKVSALRIPNMVASCLLICSAVCGQGAESLRAQLSSVESTLREAESRAESLKASLPEAAARRASASSSRYDRINEQIERLKTEVERQESRLSEHEHCEVAKKLRDGRPVGAGELRDHNSVVESASNRLDEAKRQIAELQRDRSEAFGAQNQEGDEERRIKAAIADAWSQILSLREQERLLGLKLRNAERAESRAREEEQARQHEESVAEERARQEQDRRQIEEERDERLKLLEERRAQRENESEARVAQIRAEYFAKSRREAELEVGAESRDTVRRGPARVQAVEQTEGERVLGLAPRARSYDIPREDAASRELAERRALEDRKVELQNAVDHILGQPLAAQGAQGEVDTIYTLFGGAVNRVAAEAAAATQRLAMISADPNTSGVVRWAASAAGTFTQAFTGETTRQEYGAAAEKVGDYIDTMGAMAALAPAGSTVGGQLSAMAAGFQLAGRMLGADKPLDQAMTLASVSSVVDMVRTKITNGHLGAVVDGVSVASQMLPGDDQDLVGAAITALSSVAGHAGGQFFDKEIEQVAREHKLGRWTRQQGAAAIRQVTQDAELFDTLINMPANHRKVRQGTGELVDELLGGDPKK